MCSSIRVCQEKAAPGRITHALVYKAQASPGRVTQALDASSPRRRTRHRNSGSEALVTEREKEISSCCNFEDKASEYTPFADSRNSRSGAVLPNRQLKKLCTSSPTQSAAQGALHDCNRTALGGPRPGTGRPLPRLLREVGAPRCHGHRLVARSRRGGRRLGPRCRGRLEKRGERVFKILFDTIRTECHYRRGRRQFTAKGHGQN